MAMVGYGSKLTQTTVLELRYNYNVTEYTKGDGYAQVSRIGFSLLALSFTHWYTSFLQNETSL